MNKNTHFFYFRYIVFAGIIPTLLMYYIFFRLLAVVEGYDFLVSILSIMTVSSPIAGSILGAFLFYKFVRTDESLFVNLWKNMLIHSLIVASLFELYFWTIEPLWSGFGIILCGCVGITLSIFSYLKGRQFFSKK